MLVSSLVNHINVEKEFVEMNYKIEDTNKKINNIKSIQADYNSNSLLIKTDITKIKESNWELFQKIQNLKTDNYLIEQQLKELDLELYKIEKEIKVFSNFSNFVNEDQNIKELSYNQM